MDIITWLNHLLKSRRKIGYVNRAIPEPRQMIPPLVIGSLKKCQLLQSMEPEISSEHLLLQTAKEI